MNVHVNVSSFGTRMHSSRMRTVRCSGRRGKGGMCLPRGVCLGRGGCVYPGVSARGCLPGSVRPGGCLPGGGVCPSACWDTYRHSVWTEFLTHACENYVADGKYLNNCLSTNILYRYTIC